MLGSVPVEAEKQIASVDAYQPPSLATIVTTDGQHTEAVEKVTRHLVEAGFGDQTPGTVAPQASADAVLAEIKKQTPKANPVGDLTNQIGREASDFIGGITGTEHTYLANTPGIHLVPIQRTIQASKGGVFNTIVNSFFRLMGKKKD